MTPTPGRVVLYRFPDHEEAPNQTKVVSADVVKVWSDECVNLRLKTDGPPGGHEWVTSVVRSDPDENGEPEASTWCWPVRK